MRVADSMLIAVVVLAARCGGAGSGNGYEDAETLADGRGDAGGEGTLEDSGGVPDRSGVDTEVPDARRDAETTAVELVDDQVPHSAPPIAGIVQPKDDAVIDVGKKTVFMGAGGDDVDPPETLKARWSSDKDGPLHETTLDADGYSEMIIANLTLGLHVITFEVEDSHGNVTSASIEVHVNTPPVTPEIVIEEKTPGTLTPLHATIIGDAADADGDPVELSLEWFANGLKLVGQTSETLPHELTKKGDSVTVVLRSFDGLSWGDAKQDKVTVLNTPPALEGADLSPESGPTDTEFVCLPHGASDPDETDAPTIKIEWLVSGMPVPSATVEGLAVGASSSLPADASAKGDKIVCRATPKDGLDEGASVFSSESFVLNTPPVGGTATITPQTGDKNTVFTCEVQGDFDLDADMVFHQFYWLADGVIAEGPNEPQIVPSWMSKGTSLACAAAPSDGEALGVPVQSEAVVIGNAPPVLSAVSVGPESATVETPLGCKPEAFDPDGDKLTFTFTWTINDKDAPGQSDSILPAGVAVRGDVVSCSALGTDGEAETAKVQSDQTVEIVNALPALDGAEIKPAAGGELTIFYCNPFGWKDADGDLFQVRYGWFVNDESLGFDMPGSLDGDSFNKADQIRCRVAPLNGDEFGKFVDSQTVTIDNSPPLAGQVKIDPPTGPPGTSFKCEPSGWFDPDDDQEGYLFRWFANGAEIPGKTASTLDSTGMSHGSLLSCEATPTDGSSTGTPIPSSGATVN